MARIVDAIGLHRQRLLSCGHAAEMLGGRLSERHFRRLRDAYEAEGAEGIVDGRRGRASGRRAPVDEIEWVLEQFRTRYFDFTAKHFHEAVQGRPMGSGAPFKRGYTWTKGGASLGPCPAQQGREARGGVLQSRGLLTKAPKRSVHRRRRMRRPLFGMMLFQDASRHAWLAPGPELDLVVTMDDATSRVLSIVLVEEEGTASRFRGVSEVIQRHGLFSSFYTDRGSHYFVTLQAGGKVDRLHPPFACHPMLLRIIGALAGFAQVGRALDHLGIQHIASYSPEVSRAGFAGGHFV